jgi:hypothetical protein
MLYPCYRATAAAPLLGPALRRIRSTPLARLAIGYRFFVPPAACAALKPRAPVPGSLPPAIEPLPRDCQPCPPRGLGHGLLLDRILTGGNQNEGVSLANWRIAVERLCSERGQNFDCWC